MKRFPSAFLAAAFLFSETPPAFCLRPGQRADSPVGLEELDDALRSGDPDNARRAIANQLARTLSPQTPAPLPSPTGLEEFPQVEVLNPSALSRFQLAGILFDFDDTLWVGYPRDHEALLWAQLVTRQQVPLPEFVAEVKQFLVKTVGRVWQERFNQWKAERRPKLPEDTDTFIQQFMTEIGAYIEDQQLATPAYLAPGTRRFLEALRSAGIRMAVVTAGSAERRKRYAGQMGIGEFFDQIYGEGEKVKAIRQAIHDWNLTSTQVAYVGDGVTDIRAAVQNGILAVGFAPSSEHRQKLMDAGAAVVIHRNYLASREILDTLKVPSAGLEEPAFTRRRFLQAVAGGVGAALVPEIAAGAEPVRRIQDKPISDARVTFGKQKIVLAGLPEELVKGRGAALALIENDNQGEPRVWYFQPKEPSADWHFEVKKGTVTVITEQTGKREFREGHVWIFLLKDGGSVKDLRDRVKKLPLHTGEEPDSYVVQSFGRPDLATLLSDKEFVEKTGLVAIRVDKEAKAIQLLPKSGLEEGLPVAERTNIIPVVTPLRREEDGRLWVDEAAVIGYFRYLKDQMGAQAVLVAGATGEFHRMDPGLRQSAIRILTRDARQTRLYVVANVTGATLEETLENAEIAKAEGADALLVAPAFVAKEPAEMESLVRALHDLKLGLPIGVYNNPAITQGRRVPEAVVQRLYGTGLIRFLKDSTGYLRDGTWGQSLDAYRATDIPVGQGYDGEAASSLAKGGVRWIVAASGSVVKAAQQFTRTTDPTGWRPLQDQINGVFDTLTVRLTKIPAGLKHVLSQVQTQGAPLMEPTVTDGEETLTPEEAAAIDRLSLPAGLEERIGSIRLIGSDEAEVGRAREIAAEIFPDADIQVSEHPLPPEAISSQIDLAVLVEFDEAAKQAPGEAYNDGRIPHVIAPDYWDEQLPGYELREALEGFRDSAGLEEEMREVIWGGSLGQVLDQVDHLVSGWVRSGVTRVYFQYPHSIPEEGPEGSVALLYGQEIRVSSRLTDLANRLAVTSELGRWFLLESETMNLPYQIVKAGNRITLMPVSATGLEETAVTTAVGYVVDAGVGLLRSRMEMETPYLIVAEGSRQVLTLLEAGVPAARIVALVEDAGVQEHLLARAFPGDNIFQADRFADWSQARQHVWQVAGDWLRVLEGVEVTALRTTARSVQGLLAQLKELLPLEWQDLQPVTADQAEQILRLYQIGV